MMKINAVSMLTQKVNTMYLDITQEQYDRWRAGELIQVAMNNLTATERDFLMTGMSPEEQEEFYSSLEEA